MTLTCPNCQCQLQLDDKKTPSQPFTVRCPMCQRAVKVQAPGTTNDTIQSSTPHDVISGLQLERQLAPRFNSNREQTVASSEDMSVSKDLGALSELLVEALRNAGEVSGRIHGSKRNPRKALVCSPQPIRDEAARLLAEHDYEVFVAENTAQALGTMREDRIDVLVLDAGFDPVEQGTAFMMREVRLLRSGQRRRLFLVYLSSSMKTMDQHAAFLHSVNLVFNPSDLEKLPEVLEISLRNYNELYRDFFSSLSVQPI